MTRPGNLFSGIPADIPEEIFETIAESGQVRIERIISRGQTTPRDFWYDQDLNELVVLLEGSAGILFEREPEPIDLLPGDYLIIPAHRRHRVTRTDGDGPTVWLAVHYPPNRKS
nr:cupin domain-containing protein [Syntrophorhabdaceae bacterium]